MSYDVCLNDPVTGDVIQFDSPHQIRGGNYVVGGTKDAWLNITYNYGDIMRKVIGDDGIRTINGMTGAQSIPILKKATESLGNDVSDNYWDATDGNVKRALLGLLAFAEMRPDGIWEVC